jgi:hypothetical protein
VVLGTGKVYIFKEKEKSWKLILLYSNVQLSENRKKSKLLGGDSLLGVNDKNDNELSNIKAQK